MYPEVDLTNMTFDVTAEFRMRRGSIMLPAVFAVVVGAISIWFVGVATPQFYFLVVILGGVVIGCHAICRHRLGLNCPTCRNRMSRRMTEIAPVDVGPKLYWLGCQKIDGRYYSRGPRPKRLTRIVGVCEPCQTYAVISRIEYQDLTIDDRQRLEKGSVVTMGFTDVGKKTQAASLE